MDFFFVFEKLLSEAYRNSLSLNFILFPLKHHSILKKSGEPYTTIKNYSLEMIL